MTVSPFQLLSYAEDFQNFAIEKLAFIRKLPNGKWRVVSRKGKNLGTYDSRAAAVKRLQQVEFFKRQGSDKNHPTYSSTMRLLNQEADPQTIQHFQQTFKEHFDRLYSEGEENPEEEALEIAIKSLEPLKKKAIDENKLGNPEAVGNYIVGLIHFLFRRVPNKNQPKLLKSLKRKIYYINEYELTSKKLSNSSSIGTSITIIKHLLFNKNPKYIRETLNTIVRNI
jgi:hypothetical protein